MAKPSFVLTQTPEYLGGTDYRLHMQVFTSLGNTLIIDRVITLPADTKAAFMQFCRQLAKAIDDSETAVVATPKVVSKVAEFVGVRIDATQGGNVPLAPADTPPDTHQPPLGGG